MTLRMEDTSGGAVAAAIAGERRRLGASTSGMVMTLLVLADEDCQADATQAAVQAARLHPMRIITLIPRRDSKVTRLDAEITVGSDTGGAGEVAVLRLRGLLAEHANSVAVPLLLPDTPVVAYWPGDDAPDVPSDTPLGRHAQRRITDAAAARNPIADLDRRATGYQGGDTDLAWTRLTPWRSVLATILDSGPLDIRNVSIEAERENPSAELLRRWLGTSLECSSTVTWGDGPGITSVSLHTPAGDYCVDRPDGRIAMLRRPASPDASVALPRRELSALLAEELRRLDPDEVYEETVTTP
jgi:glucose-6-phosphate dehydrogenase assembly protein OpcA